MNMTIFSTFSLRRIKRFFLVVTTILPAVICYQLQEQQAAAAVDDFWNFYDTYPQYQDFFPFGIFRGAWPLPGVGSDGSSEDTANAMIHEAFSDYYLNYVWGEQFRTHHPHFRWLYGDTLPSVGIRISLDVSHWVGYRGRGLFARYEDRDDILDEQELAVFEEEFGRDNLRRMKQAVDDFPETVTGFVIGDEPHIVPPIVAAARIVERNTGLPGLVVENSPGHVLGYAPHLPLLAADWYRVNVWYRDPWSIARDLRHVYEQSPQTNIWLTPMTGLWREYFPERSHPGLPDSELSREELRLHFWSGLALGVKGFVPWKGVSWNFGLRQGVEGSRAIINPLHRPEGPTRLLEEMSAIGRDAVTIGPLLLSCRPEQSYQINIDTERVRFPAFEGDAVEVGLLKDIKNDRYFLIPWNNDVERTRSAQITIPAGLREGREIYDMHRLASVTLDIGRRLTVELPPGGGRIFMLSDRRQFGLARQTVLRHRADRHRIEVWKRAQIAQAQGLNMGKVDELTAQARRAGEDGNWTQVGSYYRQALAAIEQIEAARRLPNISEIRADLEKIADFLSESNDLVHAYQRLFEINPAGNPPFDNPHVGDALREWRDLKRGYFRAQERFRKGEFDQAGQTPRLSRQVDVLKEQAAENLETLKQTAADRLAELRQDYRLVMISPNHTDPVTAIIFSHANENFHARWFAPDGDGNLRDTEGRLYNPDLRFDVLWIHQTRFIEEVRDGAVPDPAKVLLPELLEPAMLTSVRRHTSAGRGLLLTGIAGLYTLPLGIERTMPDRVLQESGIKNALRFDLSPAPGYDNHPLFAGFEDDAMPGNLTYGWRIDSVVSECAWENRSPSGRVIARQSDTGMEARERRQYTGFDLDAEPYRGSDYAPIVEYRYGNGKVLVLGGLSVQMMPGERYLASAPRPRPPMIRRVRRFTVNALQYLASDSLFEP